MCAYRSFVAILTSLALALQAPLSALAAGGDLAATNAPATGDDIARRCDAFSSVFDLQYSGPRTALDDTTLAEALSVCAQAADARPTRPRYVYLYGTALLAAKRYAEAARSFAWARQAGNPWGADSLAWLASQGWGEPQDNEKAAQLFREAGDGGVAVADYGLAFLYENGDGVARDANEAMRLYRRAAEGGISGAYARLMWLSLWATPPSVTDAAHWARQAADAGDADGARVLGWCYLMGKGLPQNAALAAQWYVEAARRGSADAMYQLSTMSRDGVGLPKDATNAAGWMQQAAKHGHAQAQLELARILIAGTGVAPDHRAAYGWALQAAQSGLVPAQILVASMVHDGDGVARSPSDSVAWFRKAAEHGDTFAMFELGWLVRTGDGTPRSEADAVRWFREAADHGNVSAEEALGEGYMNGTSGRGPDYRAAFYWLDRAASKGDGFAQVNLGLMYSNGWGVPRDMQRAQSLFVKATLSHEPKVVQAARENLAAMLHQQRPGRASDNTTAAVVGAALVGLALLAIFSGSDDSSVGPGSGGGTSTTAGSGPFVPSSSSTSAPSTSPWRSVPHPMTGNIGKTLDGVAGMGSMGVVRKP